MPLNPQIPLAGRPVDVAGAQASGTQERQRRTVADLVIEQKRTEIEQDNALQEIKRTGTYARDTVLPLLKAGRTDELKENLIARIDKLDAAGTNADGSRRALQLLQEGNVAELQRVSQNVIQVARENNLIGAAEKGKQFSAQLPGGKKISLVVNPQGQVVDPVTREHVPGAVKAPTRQVVGKPGDFTKKTAGEIEKKLIDAQEGLARLKSIRDKLNPKFLQFPAKLKSALLAQKEKLGFAISDEDKKSLSEFAKFKRNAASNLNRYIKEITGAQMSEKETVRLTRAVPNAGVGLFDGDSPTVFKAKMDEAIANIEASARRFHHLRENGFISEGERPSEDLVEQFPLDDFKVGTNANALDDARDAVKRGADPEKVKERLRGMNIDPEGL